MESISTKTFLTRQLDPEFSESFKKERHENILIEIIRAKELDFKKTMHFFRHIHNAGNLKYSGLLDYVNTGLTMASATD